MTRPLVYKGFVVHLSEPLTPEEEKAFKAFLDAFRKYKDKQEDNKHLCEESGQP